MTEGTAVAEATGTSGVLAWRLAPVAVGLGSLALGAVAIGHRSLTTDEGAAVAAARGSLGSVLSHIVHDDPGQAGGLLLLKLARTLGTNETALRLPFAIAVAIAAGLLVVLGTLLLGRVGGLVAGLAFAANAGVVEASREARPYALGLLGVVLATLLLVVALERGGGWRFAQYAVAAAALPLCHPLAASVLAAHGAVLIARRDRVELRAAGIALLAGTTVAGGLLAWMAVDRFGGTGGTALDLRRLGQGLAFAGGWNVVLAAGAVAGLVFLFRSAHLAAPDRSVGVLVSGLVAAPVVVTLLAALVAPVHTAPLVLASPGMSLAVGAAALLLSPTRGLVAAGVALFLVASAITIAIRQSRPVDEDWRALAAAIRHVRGARETVVVIPDGSRAALAFYAPYLPTMRFARGEGAWVVVAAGSNGEAIEASRLRVSTPRYALLRQVRYGDHLRLQHWVRP